MFCTPARTSGRSRIASTTTWSDAAGGTITTVRSGRRAWCVRKRRMYAFASLGPTCIFQFAAKPGRVRVSAVTERRNAGQLLALENLQGRTAACGHVTHGVLESCLGDGRRGIATADDRRRARLRGIGQRARDREG